MQLPLLTLIAALVAGPALAEPSTRAGTPAGTFSVERHFTTNALDSDVEVSDWYSLLRGSIADEWMGDSAEAKITTEIELTRYDRQSIEDDRTLVVTVDAKRRIGGRSELRGTVGYSIASEGDDLQIGPLLLGTRTLTQSLVAETQLGINMGADTTLVIAVADAVDRPELTTFAPSVLKPLKLKPARNRFVASAKLARALGPASVGLVTSLDLVSVEAIGWPPASLSYRLVTARGEATYTSDAGLVVSIAAGVETIRSAFGLFEASRPTYLASVTWPALATVELAARAAAAFDSADSDDPMASWVQRAEARIVWRPREVLEFGGGAFAQVKDNPLLGNRELAHGFNLEAAWRFSKRFALVARADYSGEVATVIGTRQSTFDTFIGLSADM